MLHTAFTKASVKRSLQSGGENLAPERPPRDAMRGLSGYEIASFCNLVILTMIGYSYQREKHTLCHTMYTGQS